jgi:hypothetical protein
MSNPIHINKISNRQYILSPTVKNGLDRECSSKDFCNADENDIDIGKLGMGIHVRHIKTSNEYIIINFEKEKVKNNNLQEKINKTLELMYKCIDPYIFRLLNHYEEEENVFLIFEMYEGETLAKKIQSNKIDKEDALKYFTEIIMGIKKFHSLNVFNINICPENILIGDCVKITDYGIKMSRKNEPPNRKIHYLKKGNYNITINSYTTPEEIIGIQNNVHAKLSKKTDSWNVGILLYEMLTGFQCPFKNYNSSEEMINSILNAELDLEKIEDEFCRMLIEKLVRKEQEDRIDIDDIISNFDEIKNVNIEQPILDPDDCIINDGEDDSYAPVMRGNYDYDGVIEDLRNENENLKMMVENLKNRMSLMSEDFNFKSLKPGKNEYEYDRESNVINNKVSLNNEFKGHIVTDSELNRKEVYLDEKLKNFGDKKISINNEYDFSDDDDENDDDLNLLSKEKLIEKVKFFKNKNDILKNKLKNEIELKKNFENLNMNLNKKNFELQEKIKLNEFDKIEKLNEKNENNINELNVKLNKLLEIFSENENEFKILVEKLIKMSEDSNKKLIEENENFINNNDKKIINIINQLKNFDFFEEKNNKKFYNDQINQMNKQIDELLLYKKNNEIIKDNNENLINKNKILENDINILKENINLNEIKKKELNDYINNLKKEIFLLENKLGEAKVYVVKNFSENERKIEKFFELIGNTNDQNK